MPKDKRIYITLAVDMDRNPKLADLTDGQKWLLVKAIMHCREFTTDGEVKLSVWTKMGTNRNRIAVESCGAITVDRSKKVAIVNDYSEHNQTRADIEKASEAKKTAGQKGGQARAANFGNASSSQAAATADAKQPLKQKVAEVEVEVEKEVITNVITLGESSAKPVTTPASKPAARKRTATPPTRISEDWQPTREAVDKLRPDTPDVDLQRETANFVDYWLGKPGKAGEKQDWTATWRKWMRTAQTDIEARTARTAPRRPGYGGPTGPCHPNGTPLTSGEIKFAQVEARKDFPNPDVLKLAGIPLTPQQRANLGMIPAADNLVIDAEPDHNDLLFAPPARAIS